MHEEERLTSRFSHKSEIDETIGKETWRQSQSVVDLIQNHLDACTTVYEKSLLGALGNVTYLPADRYQQQIVEHLDLMKHASPDRVDLEYSCIQALSPDTPTIVELVGRLALVTQPMPRVRLLMTNGVNKQLIDYEDVRSVSADWTVVGFRVDDEGAGFDDNLLPVLGMSMKKDQLGKRGGLGEGLKVSVAHLARAGATVRLASRNADEFWIARPVITDGIIEFNGIQKKGSDPRTTGSLTDVDFSEEHVDATFRSEIPQILDPRLGEGLGKYVLEFRGTELLPRIHESCNLSPMGVVGGRVYVKGLLVEERSDLLFSYNLGNKWGISGRDRKTAQESDLYDVLCATLQSLDSFEEIAQLLRANNSRVDYQELAVLRHKGAHQLAHPEIWKRAVEDVYSFEPGKCLFASSMNTSAELRFAEERGYKVIVMPSIQFFVELYKGSTVTVDQLARTDQAGSQAFVERKVMLVCEQHTDDFVSMVQRVVPQEVLFISADTAWRIRGMKFMTDSLSTEIRPSHFRYDKFKQVMRVTPHTEKNDFSMAAELYIELVKAMCSRDVHDTVTQELLTQLTTGTMMAHDPALLENLELSQAQESGHLERGLSYSEEEKNLDAELISFHVLVHQLDNLDISKTEVERILAEIWTLEESGLIARSADDIYVKKRDRILSAVLHRRYSFDGTMYWWDLYLHQLDSFLTDNRVLEPGTVSATLLKTEGCVYLPISLREGEVIQIIISEGGRDYISTVKRDHGRMSHRYVDHDPEDTYVRAGHNYVEIGFLYEDVLVTPKQDVDISISEPTLTPKPQLAERNQGKDYIKARFTLDYGGDVWADPRRILIDALQNHIDAQKGTMPDIEFTIVDSQGNLSRVSSDELRIHNQTWKVIGVQIKDTGLGYTTPYLTQIGTSRKGINDSGRFGEGLKILSAAALRQGIHVELRSRNWVATPAIHSQTVFDYESGVEKSFDLMGYNMRWETQIETGAQTSFSLFPHLEEVAALTSEQQTIVHQLGEGESGGGNAWNTWVRVLDPRNVNERGERGINAYVLNDDSSEIIRTGESLSLLPQRPGDIYERGLLILKDPSPSEESEFIFGYNVDGTIINTRERNNYDKKLLDAYLRRYFGSLEDPQVMNILLESVKMNGSKQFYEYDFLRAYVGFTSEGEMAMWRAEFYKVYGNDAILSMKGGFGVREMRAAANEVHLENVNLVTVPPQLVEFFVIMGVKTSADFIDQLETESVTLSSNEREQLDRFVIRVNAFMCDQLEVLLTKPDAQAYLDQNVVQVEILKTRLLEMRSMTGDSVVVRHPSFSARGLFELVDGKPVISLNQKLFADKRGLCATYVHEMCHFLSGRPDYEQGFQGIFIALMLAVSWNQESQSSGPQQSPNFTALPQVSQ